MAKVEVRLNTKEIGDWLRSSEMRDMLQQVAGDVAAKCGPGYETDTKQMATRYIASVWPETKEAARDNFMNDRLLKVL